MKEPDFYRKKLDNGLVVLFEKRKVPVVSVATAVKSGAQYEPENLKGISHFIEHLVFKGTKNRTVEQIPKDIEGRGGIINAFTGEELTVFWNKLPGKHFNLGADIAIDLILNPLFENEALERERKVILEEIKMYHDNPSTYVIEKIKEMLYEKPFSISIAGTHETVSSLSREKVLKFYNSVYTSNNMIFCIVGNTDFDQVLEQAKKFPKLNRVINPISIVTKNQEVNEKRKDIDQAHEVFGFHMPKLDDKNRYAAEIFDNILGGGMASRLFQEVREKRGLCYSIKSNLEQSKDYSYEIIYAGALKEKVKEIKELIIKEVLDMKNLNKADFEEAKERLIGLKEVGRERGDSTMSELILEEVGGNAENYYSYGENINSVKLNDVKSLSKLKGYSFVSLVPE
jgi:predicted Zn-dependent peptidase